MEQKNDRVRIDFTDAQKKQIKEQAGKDVEGLELSVKELEQRIAPLTKAKWNL